MRKTALLIGILACFPSCVSSAGKKETNKETKRANPEYLPDDECAAAIPSPGRLSANFYASVTVSATPVGKKASGKLASGVVVSAGGGRSLILTAAHAFNNGDKYTVKVMRVLPCGKSETIAAELVAVDYSVDLALVSVPLVFPSTVQIGSSQNLPEGVCLYAISTFRGKVPLVLTRGYLISTLAVIKVNTGRGAILSKVLKTYLSIVGGSSGGGVFDQHGRLVGFIEARERPLAFAVPVENVRSMLEKYLEKKD